MVQVELSDVTEAIFAPPDDLASFLAAVRFVEGLAMICGSG